MDILEQVKFVQDYDNTSSNTSSNTSGKRARLCSASMRACSIGKEEEEEEEEEQRVG